MSKKVPDLLDDLIDDYEKGQYWNCIAITNELMREFIRLFDNKLKNKKGD